MKRHRVLLFLSLLGGIYFTFFGLGSVPLFDWDEAVYAEVTREMLESNDYLTPQYNGDPFFDKPILLYWLMALAFKLLGPTEFAARFWSSVSGCGLLLITYWFGARMSGKRVGLLSILILASSIEFIVLSHAAVTDMLVTFFITSALYCFYLSSQENDGSTLKWVLVAYISMAFAVLTKGPIGILIPVATFMIYLTVIGRWREGMLLKYHLLGVGLFFLVALPWYMAMIDSHGRLFIEDFILKHNVGRFTGVMEGHAGTPFYYLGVLAIGFFPWSPFLPVMIKNMMPRKLSDLRSSDPAQRLAFFLLIWTGFIFLFFSLSGTKLPNYIAPLFPPLSLGVAVWWNQWQEQSQEKPRGFGLSLGLLILTAGVISLVLLLSPFILDEVRNRYVESAPYLLESLNLGRVPLLLSLPLIGGIFMFLWTVKLNKPFISSMVLVLMMGVFSFILLTRVAPIASDYMQTPLTELSRIAGRQLQSNERLVVYGIKKPSVLFYARRSVIQIKKKNQDQLKTELDRPGRLAIISKISLRDTLLKHPGFNEFAQRKGYVLVTNF